MRKYYHILINPKITTGDKYNELVRKYLTTKLNLDDIEKLGFALVLK